MAGPAYALSPARGAGEVSAARAVGILKSKVESLNRLGNLLSEDVSQIAIEIDRISGCQPQDANKVDGPRPESSDLDSLQTQIDRLDRLAQFTRLQLDRLRAI